MELVYLIYIILIGALVGVAGYLFLSQHRHLQVLRDLCALRQNALDTYREELKVRIAYQIELATDLNDIIQAVQQFFRRHNDLQEAPRSEQEVLREELTKQQTINDDLAQELSKLLSQNQALEEKVVKFLKQEQRLEEVMANNFELRDKLQRLEERNVELEYAINLESISMIEGYEEKDKLYGAIDDVRRSLTRILNSA